MTESEITFPAADGFPLSGRLLVPDRPRAAALISPGTGFPKEFYLNFARAGAERGAACLVFDFRGLAGSAPKDLRSFVMDCPDWGRLDMPAALERLAEAAPGVPVVHVGHSVGGHVVGFMPNHARIARHVFVGVGFGTWWTHRFPQPLVDLFFWWAYGPFFLATRGFIPSGGLWGGAALPAGAFRTWRRWSHKGDYFRRELDGRLKPHHFEAVAAPIVSYVFTDDPLTSPAAARRFLEFLPNAKAELRVRRPSELGVRSLGHQDVFRRASAAAWPEIWSAAGV